MSISEQNSGIEGVSESDQLPTVLRSDSGEDPPPESNDEGEGNSGDDEDEEDPIDPKDVLTEKCSETAKCKSLKGIMDECTERVESHPGTHEKCTQELFDFMGCVDLCVSKHLFKYLK